MTVRAFHPHAHPHRLRFRCIGGVAALLAAAAAGNGCTAFASLTGNLALTALQPGQVTGATAYLDVAGEEQHKDHKGGDIALTMAVQPGTTLSFSLAGSYQSLGDPMPPSHALFAFAPGAVVGPAQGVPQTAPQIVLGTLKSGSFEAYTLGGAIYAFGGIQQVGTWSANVTSAVPEPGRWALSSLGLAMLCFARRKSSQPRTA